MSERYTVHLDDLIEAGIEHKLAAFRGRCAVANGCFDGLHPGHLEILAALDTIAYTRGFRPIVAINSDLSVRRLKGPSRPLIPQRARSLLINYLKWPFTVVIFDEDSPQRLMDYLMPAVVVKGSEYTAESVVKWSGSEVVSVDMLPGWSTTSIIGDTR